MGSFLELFGTSSKWGQTSNSAFTEFLINENRQLKCELERYKKQAEYRQQELLDEVSRLHEVNKQLSMKNARSKLAMRDTSSITAPVEQEYPPASILNVNNATNESARRVISTASALTKQEYAPTSFLGVNDVANTPARSSTSTTVNAPADQQYTSMSVMSTNITDKTARSTIPNVANTSIEQTYTPTFIHNAMSTTSTAVDPPSKQEYVPTSTYTPTSIVNAAVICSSTGLEYIPTPINRFKRRKPASKNSTTTTIAQLPEVATRAITSQHKRSRRNDTQKVNVPSTDINHLQNNASVLQTPTLYDPMMVSISSEGE